MNKLRKSGILEFRKARSNRLLLRISCGWRSVSGMSPSHSLDQTYMNSDPASSNQELCFSGAITGLVLFASDRMVMKQLEASSPKLGSSIRCTIFGLTRIFRPGKIYGMQHGINMVGKNQYITQSHLFRKWNPESWSHRRPRPSSEAMEWRRAYRSLCDKCLSSINLNCVRERHWSVNCCI